MTEITTKTGDILESSAQTLTNTVNCVGVMGKGIALAFKKRFPEMFADYVERCARGEVVLGRPYLYKQEGGPWILNFPTKGHWRAVSRLSDIEKGLHYLVSHYRNWGIRSIAVPPLGCGHGQLDWEIVGPTLYKYLSKLDIPVEMYAPHGTPPEQMKLAFLRAEPVERLRSSGQTDNTISAAAVALAAVVSRINREPHHWPVGRTTFQKIAYFLTEAGVPTGLEYSRRSFGPFASDLKRLQSRLINNGVLREERAGRMFRIALGPTYCDARERYKPQLREWAPKIERVADLFLRFRTTNDAELAATVHYATKELMTKRSRPTEEAVLEEVTEWKRRRRPPLHEEAIASTIRNLGMLRWVDVEASQRVADLADEPLAIPD